jgi:hypothetical protein
MNSALNKLSTQQKLLSEMKLIMCHNGLKCKAENCRFDHPAAEECRFGTGCNNEKCLFAHTTVVMCRNDGQCKVEGCVFTHTKQSVSDEGSSKTSEHSFNEADFPALPVAVHVDKPVAEPVVEQVSVLPAVVEPVLPTGFNAVVEQMVWSPVNSTSTLNSCTICPSVSSCTRRFKTDHTKCMSFHPENTYKKCNGQNCTGKCRFWHREMINGCVYWSTFACRHNTNCTGCGYYRPPFSMMEIISMKNQAVGVPNMDVGNKVYICTGENCPLQVNCMMYPSAFLDAFGIIHLGNKITINE